tara:strand:- start:29842 stop:30141 length:300 start_codon:yes stop_codon:yes gene_type:complete
MVSDDLQSLYEKLSTYQGTGLSMTPAGLKSVCAILQSAIQDIEIMENQPCKSHKTGLRETSHVVDIARARSRQAMKKWLKGQGIEILPPQPSPDGGDAA